MQREARSLSPARLSLSIATWAWLTEPIVLRPFTTAGRTVSVISMWLGLFGS